MCVCVCVCVCACVCVCVCVCVHVCVCVCVCVCVHMCVFVCVDVHASICLDIVYNMDIVFSQFQYSVHMEFRLFSLNCREDMVFSPGYVHETCVIFVEWVGGACLNSVDLYEGLLIVIDVHTYV